MQPLKCRGAAEQRPNQPVNCRNIFLIGFFNWYHLCFIPSDRSQGINLAIEA